MNHPTLILRARHFGGERYRRTVEDDPSMAFALKGPAIELD